MWGGRFSRPPAKAAEEFSRSLHFDSRLALCDIAGSAAHARALNRAGILSAKELAALSKAWISCGPPLPPARRISRPGRRTSTPG